MRPVDVVVIDSLRCRDIEGVWKERLVYSTDVGRVCPFCAAEEAVADADITQEEVVETRSRPPRPGTGEVGMVFP